MVDINICNVKNSSDHDFCLGRNPNCLFAYSSIEDFFIKKMKSILAKLLMAALVYLLFFVAYASSGPL